MNKTEAAKLCFVVGPIGPEDSQIRIHADWLLQMIIQPVMAEFPEFETRRADQITQPGMIDAQVINALLTADLVIADLSTLNPNAFYEIGIRHVAQKPIIHMQLKDENIPIDVNLYRAIKFSLLRPRDIDAAKDELKAQVKAVLADNYTVENPVTRARGTFQLQQHATPAEQVLLEQLRGINERLDNISAISNGAYDMAMRALGSPPTDMYAPVVARNPQNALSRITRKYWKFLVDFDPELIGSQRSFDEAILNAGPSNVENMIKQDDKQPNQIAIYTRGSGVNVTRYMDRVKVIPGVKAVHSAEENPEK